MEAQLTSALLADFDNTRSKYQRRLDTVGRVAAARPKLTKEQLKAVHQVTPKVTEQFMLVQALRDHITSQGAAPAVNIDRHSHQLGKGRWGTVYRGVWQGRACAIKMQTPVAHESKRVKSFMYRRLCTEIHAMA